MIGFIPAPGVRRLAQRRGWIPVNLDDGLPHAKRCRLNQELAEAKRVRREAPRQTAAKKTPQREMF